MFNAVYGGEVKVMKVAVPVSRNRISPVFDSAGNLLIVDFDDGRESSRRQVKMENGSPLDRVNRLVDNGVEVLLCGAISRNVTGMVEAVDIRVIPFLTGDVEILLQAFIEGRVSDPKFLMPGRNARRRRRIRRRYGSSNEREIS